ncbi:MAG TPA: ATP-binding protein [Flavitalea sp.]|nr:ATP-binding protein [Flavitalea sp.]
MDETQKEVVLIIVISTALILLLCGIVVTGLLIQQKRKLRHQKQLLEMNNIYEKSLLESQLRIQEETFQAISQNLHDNIGSNISTAMLLLYKDEQSSDQEMEDNRREALGMLDRIVDDLRNLARSLNAGFLDDIGLNEAIRSRVQQLERSKKFSIKLSIDEIPQQIDRHKQVMLFYIFQESINNITKHSHAKVITIDLRYEKEKMIMQIKDDGEGMAHVEPRNINHKGSGLINIKNHATLMGATLEIHSERGNGTEIIVTLPDPYQ